MKVVTDMGPRTVNIFWQVPLYFVITLAECLFSVTGLAFAYSQVALVTSRTVTTVCNHIPMKPIPCQLESCSL